MEKKSLNYLITVSDLLRDYARARLAEIREEARMLEAFMGDNNEEAVTARDADRVPLRAQIESILRLAPAELRIGEIADRLQQVHGITFASPQHAGKKIQQALATSTVTQMRKEGTARNGPVYYSIKNDESSVQTSTES
jgi:chromosome condensin MukBEF ATPase and DNA-binding subunit MukB